LSIKFVKTEVAKLWNFSYYAIQPNTWAVCELKSTQWSYLACKAPYCCRGGRCQREALNANSRMTQMIARGVQRGKLFRTSCVCACYAMGLLCSHRDIRNPFLLLKPPYYGYHDNFLMCLPQTNTLCLRQLAQHHPPRPHPPHSHLVSLLNALFCQLPTIILQLHLFRPPNYPLASHALCTFLKFNYLEISRTPWGSARKKKSMLFHTRFGVRVTALEVHQIANLLYILITCANYFLPHWHPSSMGALVGLPAENPPA
jgi:hypothetical protein